jgi:hypothetical protein
VPRDRASEPVELCDGCAIPRRLSAQRCDDLFRHDLSNSIPASRDHGHDACADRDGKSVPCLDDDSQASVSTTNVGGQMVGGRVRFSTQVFVQISLAISARRSHKPQAQDSSIQRRAASLEQLVITRSDSNDSIALSEPHRSHSDLLMERATSLLFVRFR